MGIALADVYLLKNKFGKQNNSARLKELLTDARNRHVKADKTKKRPKQQEIAVAFCWYHFDKKKDRHTQTVADWFRDDVYPRIVNRYPKVSELDYLFFPNEENREKLFNRIRKNFIRVSDKIGLYDVNGQKRPIYTFRHSFISNRRSKEVDPNIVAIHSNTSVAMINKHYQDLSDDNLVNIHNQLYPERTKKPQKY